MKLHLTLPLHELALCEWVLLQVLAVAASQNVQHVGRIILHIGPLADLEPDLVRFAFPIVAAGTPCERTTLKIEPALVEVCCRVCCARSNVPANRLFCAGCGTSRVDLIGGDGLSSVCVELSDLPSEWSA
jgi:hydrogenase nickel incorporation protein HypA/HybF